jgi:hypothetical protein
MDATGLRVIDVGDDQPDESTLASDHFDPRNSVTLSPVVASFAFGTTKRPGRRTPGESMPTSRASSMRSKSPGRASAPALSTSTSLLILVHDTAADQVRGREVVPGDHTVPGSQPQLGGGGVDAIDGAVGEQSRGADIRRQKVRLGPSLLTKNHLQHRDLARCGDNDDARPRYGVAPRPYDLNSRATGVRSRGFVRFSRARSHCHRPRYRILQRDN